MSFPRRLPTPLSERILSAGGGLFNRQGREFDVAIGGIPFLMATYPDAPQSIETVKVQKDQFDTEDPGEQSLSGWWRRSQASFHEGAGFLYEESSIGTNIRVTPSFGFYDSEGVYVFDKGKLTLLPKAVAASTSYTAHSRVRVWNGGITAVADGELVQGPIDGPFISDAAPGGEDVIDGFKSGSDTHYITDAGKFYINSDSWTLAGGTPTRTALGKFRDWVIGGSNIWQPDITQTPGSSLDPLYTNPTAGWSYSCIAEGPSAMYFGGDDGRGSAIQAITLDTSISTAPYMSSATTVAVFPDGEYVQELAVIGGQYIGIGTSKGFRIGVINADSSITYGPLLIELKNSVCTAIAAHSRFFVAAWDVTDGDAKAYRFDTGTQLADGVFPYASDINLGFPGNITSLAISDDDRIVATGSDSGIYCQSDTELVDTGWIQSGRIRFRTTEHKTFRFFGVGIDPLAGQIAYSIVLSNGSSVSLGTISETGEEFNDFFKYAGDPMEFVSYRLDLVPADDNLTGPTVRSVLIRALPAVKPQRIITLPLLCYDQEQAKSGQRYGGTNYSTDRLNALELLEDLGEIITFQDFSGAFGNHEVVVEALKFIQTAAPKGPSDTGGIILLELRTVDV